MRLLSVLASLIILALPVQNIMAENVLKTASADEFFAEYDRRSEDGNTVVLDVRTPEEYEAGHAGGALNLNFYDEDFRQTLDELDKSSAYFIYCRSGSRSGRTLDMMREMGFATVYDLAGGWSRNSRRLSAIKDE